MTTTVYDYNGIIITKFYSGRLKKSIYQLNDKVGNYIELTKEQLIHLLENFTLE